ncbi:MAG: hypothetical protein NUW21_00935, partial [Elusimicrobia bacterium]|nr:hypothetical protein [Elusimicrobiota bacterium]
MKRPLAFALAFLIVALSPGAPAYQAFAQTVGRTGTAAGSTGDAATSVNAGVNGGGMSAPLALPAQSLGLNGALGTVAAPALSAAAVPALAPSVANAGPVAAFAAPHALSVPAKALPAASIPAAAKPLVPGALQPAAKTNAPGGASAAAKQIESLSQTAKPVLEGVKQGDATGALNAVYENATSRAELGAVRTPSGSAALRQGLKRS